MNIHDIQSCFTLACAAGGIICIAAILLYSVRHQLRQLFERWLAFGRLGQCVSLLMLMVFVLYGGTKPPSSTNEPTAMMASVKTVTGSGEAESFPLVPKATRSTDNETLACMVPSAGRNSACGVLSLQAEGIPLPHSLTNWTARGAYCDWQRIDFPDGFAFPSGTNLLTGVTLMSWGELRCNDGALAVGLHQSATTGASSLRIVSLPSSVSFEPGVSTCAYGLTASNSFVFAWNDACVDREATNRVDAAIELFASGDVQMRFGDSVTNIVARPPEGFVGIGQDNAWALAAFPDDYDAITNKGYEAWLMEDKVGINEQNGLYKATITVENLPDEGPCYLVCGPYKLVVTAPGSYPFPLEVFEHYEARTYPTAVPISVVYDDGYRGEGEMVLPPQNHAPLRLASASLILPVYFPASFYAWPSQIQLSQAQNAIIALWCNLSISVECVWHSRSSSTLIGLLPPSMAEIRSVFEADDIEFVKRTSKGEARCVVSVMPDHSECCCGSCTGIGCSCGCACHRHESGGSETNGVPSSGTQP